MLCVFFINWVGWTKSAKKFNSLCSSFFSFLFIYFVMCDVFVSTDFHFQVKMNESADYFSHEFDYQADFTQVCLLPCRKSFLFLGAHKLVSSHLKAQLLH